VQAFEQGAIDYLVKPIVPDRLHDTVQRLQRRLADGQAQAQDGERLDAVLARLAAQMRQHANAAPWLQWIKASVGNAVRLIPVEEVAYLRSDEKYTLVVWSGGEALIRKPIRELIDELDPARFAQVHRSVIVNLNQVVQVVRGANETADVHLQGRSETLHLFKQM
jgi:DNA-binding LytR/AlgR family response regulator